MKSADPAVGSASGGTEARLPLEGIRVIEQGAFITGPYASMLLADMGADVIKVERPGTGDAFRSYDGTL
ncbi:CoA transferase, partial [Nocardioides sp.]|uniref:CoA transferase n=1 Tax=Nocardioides sp. TaxID=35761 RepID=UPI0031FEEFB0